MECRPGEICPDGAFSTGASGGAARGESRNRGGGSEAVAGDGLARWRGDGCRKIDERAIYGRCTTMHSEVIRRTGRKFRRWHSTRKLARRSYAFAPSDAGIGADRHTRLRAGRNHWGTKAEVLEENLSHAKSTSHWAYTDVVEVFLEKVLPELRKWRR
jgi:hypothetical protein